MRGVSLSQEPVFSLLESEFVVGWKNIIGEQYVGESRGYGPEQAAVGTTNGAGPHNVQMLVLSSDGVVIHALPGFWHPQDLAAELRFAGKLHAIWEDESLPLLAKKTLASALQLAEIDNNTPQMVSRSTWQGFDRQNEFHRLKQEGHRDTFTYSEDGANPAIKSTNIVMHERMAMQPFVRLGDFEMMAFMDYGRRLYDNNRRVDGDGVVFMTPDRVEKKRRIGDKRRKLEERRAQARAAHKRNLDERRRKNADRVRKAQERHKARAAQRKRQADARHAKTRHAHQERIARNKLRAEDRRKKLAEASKRRLRDSKARAEERRRKALERNKKREERKKRGKPKKSEVFTATEASSTSRG